MEKESLIFKIMRKKKAIRALVITTIAGFIGLLSVFGIGLGPGIAAFFIIDAIEAKKEI